jgi:uncharacterized protein YjbI with pentapeptide repeats
MKPVFKTILAASVVIGLSLGASVMAQNAGQIARAQAGASCAKCNLFQAEFGGLELKGKNFAGARLRQANFSLGIFNRSSFAGADLRDLDAYGALFSSANFSGANMTNANFVGTYLEGANLRGAILDGANFSGAEMGSARGLTQRQLDKACGDEATILPSGLRIRYC